MTRPVPVRCAGCGKLAPAAAPMCGHCRATLEHVCYGKHRHRKVTARIIAQREREVGGKETAKAYECPLCEEWHTGNDSPLGSMTYADAVLICLRLRRFHRPALADLAEAWRPEVADRAAWRARVSPHRIKIATEEIRSGDQDSCPA